jgi:hypothetical protein
VRDNVPHRSKSIQSFGHPHKCRMCMHILITVNTYACLLMFMSVLCGNISSIKIFMVLTCK